MTGPYPELIPWTRGKDEIFYILIKELNKC